MSIYKLKTEMDYINTTSQNKSIYKEVIKKMDKNMKKYDIVFTISAVSKNIAESVEKDMIESLLKSYRDIVVISEVKGHPQFEGVVSLQKEVNISYNSKVIK